jgi:hypothetical protein
MKQILIMSKLPPPIGGVTIHVQRLLYQMKSNDEFKVEVLDYSKERGVFTILKKIFTTKVVHIHLSNKRIRFFSTLIFRLLFKKVLITFHGMYNFQNSFDKLSLKISNASILLNHYSYQNALSLKGKGVHKVGAFIAPIEELSTPLETNTIEQIRRLKKNFEKVFCTNASSLVYDEKNREIYMGSEIVEYFKSKKDIALVFSSPDDTYFKFLKEKFSQFPDNIFFITKKHDFINVIKESDALIRATTMDGDSLSVKEALYFKKVVFATDVVDRPKGVICFSTFSDFDEKYKYESSNLHTVKDSYSDIANVYHELLKTR